MRSTEILLIAVDMTVHPYNQSIQSINNKLNIKSITRARGHRILLRILRPLNVYRGDSPKDFLAFVNVAIKTDYVVCSYVIWN